LRFKIGDEVQIIGPLFAGKSGVVMRKGTYADVVVVYVTSFGQEFLFYCSDLRFRNSIRWQEVGF
jgi:transcription antitermination factor NusG